jgi:DUF971 family protein
MWFIKRLFNGLSSDFGSCPQIPRDSGQEIRAGKGALPHGLSEAARSLGFRLETQMNQENTPWPTELKVLNNRSAMAVTFDDGTSFTLPAEYLRVESPSAEVQGHSPDERKTVPGKRNVMILEVLPVGNYAVRLVFDDMHSTGIYSWAYLHELGREHETRFQRYLDELAAKGLSRDPGAPHKHVH